MAKGDWQRKLMAWLQGREGPDDLAVFLVNLATVLLVVNIFARVGLLTWVIVAMVAYALFRVQSRNVPARARENAAFLKALGPLRPWVQNPGAAFAEVRAYKHLKCPKCSQRVRVPRGKGTLRITCPKCHERFEARS